jgi:hypothetical protein
MAADPRDLCTIDDVKAASEPPITNNSRDTIIQTLITSASIVLQSQHLERELTPQSTAARGARVRTQERQVDGTLVVDLAPWDLRSVAAGGLVLHPEDAAPIALTANSDYVLEPFGAPQGSYQRIRLSRYLVVISNFEVRFGYAQLQINGNWGLWNTATVDADVRDACVLTVRSWLRQNPGAYMADLNAALDKNVQPNIPSTWFVPRAALSRLKRWQRLTA